MRPPRRSVSSGPPRPTGHVPALGAVLLNNEMGCATRIAAAEALGAIGGGEDYLEEILEAGDYVDEDVQDACNKAHGSW